MEAAIMGQILGALRWFVDQQSGEDTSIIKASMQILVYEVPTSNQAMY